MYFWLGEIAAGEEVHYAEVFRWYSRGSYRDYRSDRLREHTRGSESLVASSLFQRGGHHNSEWLGRALRLRVSVARSILQVCH